MKNKIQLTKLTKFNHLIGKLVIAELCECQHNEEYNTHGHTEMVWLIITVFDDTLAPRVDLSSSAMILTVCGGDICVFLVREFQQPATGAPFTNMA